MPKGMIMLFKKQIDNTESEEDKNEVSEFFDMLLEKYMSYSGEDKSMFEQEFEAAYEAFKQMKEE